MSLLTPVYVAGQLKGIVLLDINKKQSAEYLLHS